MGHKTAPGGVCIEEQPNTDAEPMLSKASAALPDFPKPELGTAMSKGGIDKLRTAQVKVHDLLRALLDCLALAGAPSRYAEDTLPVRQHSDDTPAASLAHRGLRTMVVARKLGAGWA